jgi:DDE family transposase
VREAEGRTGDPSGSILDSQAVKSTGGPERGYDGAKRLAGRKRHLLVDTNGLVLGVHVHAANQHETVTARSAPPIRVCKIRSQVAGDSPGRR